MKISKLAACDLGRSTAAQWLEKMSSTSCGQFQLLTATCVAPMLTGKPERLRHMPISSLVFLGNLFQRVSVGHKSNRVDRHIELGVKCAYCRDD